MAYILTVYNMGSCMSKVLTNKPNLKSAIDTCDMDQSRHGSSHKSGSYTSQPQVPPINLSTPRLVRLWFQSLERNT